MKKKRSGDTDKKKISNQNKGHFRTDIEKIQEDQKRGTVYETNRTDLQKRSINLYSKQDK
ncbi:hypothetical protein HYD47_03020 [Mycoplasmopsis bovis]|nr:hypothetical protein [Mycoplasmopsis bovis]QQH78024.1 hypothetical protein HYD47_03020 [Mycoplasmopsis bovis]